MDKESIKIGPFKIGEEMTLSSWEVQVIKGDPICDQNVPVRELIYGLTEGDNLKFRTLGRMYSKAAKLIEETLVKNEEELKKSALLFKNVPQTTEE